MSREIHIPDEWPERLCKAQKKGHWKIWECPEVDIHPQLTIKGK
jgi:hypothetical protein